MPPVSASQRQSVGSASVADRWSECCGCAPKRRPHPDQTCRAVAFPLAPVGTGHGAFRAGGCGSVGSEDRMVITGTTAPLMARGPAFGTQEVGLTTAAVVARPVPSVLPSAAALRSLAAEAALPGRSSDTSFCGHHHRPAHHQSTLIRPESPSPPRFARFCAPKTRIFHGNAPNQIPIPHKPTGTITFFYLESRLIL